MGTADASGLGVTRTGVAGRAEVLPKKELRILPLRCQGQSRTPYDLVAF